MKKIILIISVIFMPILFPFTTLLCKIFHSEESIHNHREIPTANGNGYIHFYEIGTEYDALDSGVEFFDLPRDEDITMAYDYYVIEEQYNNFISENGSERLDKLTFFFADNRDSIVYSDDSWTMDVDQSSLLFDQEVSGTITLESDSFATLLNSKQNDYVLKVFWGIDGTDQESSFLFGNTDHEWWSYETITLHFQPSLEFYQPEIWLEDGTPESHGYFGADNTIGFNYDLPYNTYATAVYLDVYDEWDDDFNKKYNAEDIDDEFDVSDVSWETEFDYIKMNASEFVDADQYHDRYKFNVVVGMDWETLDESGNVIDSGYIDTTMSDNGTTDYLTFYLEDLYMNIGFDNSVVEIGSIAKLEYAYRSNYSSVSFFANKIDLVVDRVNIEDNSIEDTLVTSLIDRDVDEPEYIIGESGEGSIDIDTSYDSSFFLVNKSYNARIVVEDLRYEHWSFLNYEWISDDASFTLVDEGTVIDIEDQELSITVDSVNYGEDIVIEYAFNNLTNPYLLKYNIVFKEDEVNEVEFDDVIVNDYIINESGSLTITFDEYVDKINYDWTGEVYINYSLTNEGMLVPVNFNSNEISYSFIDYNSDENGYLWLIILIVLVVLIIIIILVIV